MATFYFFKINKDDLFINTTTNGKLNLNHFREVMVTHTATRSNEDKAVNGEGFINPIITTLNTKDVLISSCTIQGSLGYYNQAFLNDDENISSNRVQHIFYTQAKVMITEDYEVVLYFEFSEETSGKSKAKSLVEELELDLETVRFSHELLTKIKENHKWTAAKMEKLDRIGDSTRTVSFEIDPADEGESQIDEIYNDSGKLTHLTFDFKVDDTNTITIKLYKDNHGFIQNTEIENFPLSVNDVLIQLFEKLDSL